MHWEKDYTLLEGEEKRERAVQDVKEYIDDETRFQAIVNAVNEVKDLTSLEFALGMFVGIEGYPVRALWETYRKEESDDGHR